MFLVSDKKNSISGNAPLQKELELVLEVVQELQMASSRTFVIELSF